MNARQRRKRARLYDKIADAFRESKLGYAGCVGVAANRATWTYGRFNALGEPTFRIRASPEEGGSVTALVRTAAERRRFVRCATAAHRVWWDAEKGRLEYGQ